MYRKLQSSLLLALALVQPMAGRLARITGRGSSIEDRAHAARGAVTPPNGAFAIWGPLFAGNLALAVRSFFRRRFESRANDWISWLSGITLAGNTAWSLQAQFCGLRWPSFGIISASALAASAATVIASRTDDTSGFAAAAARTTGALAGWLTVAAFANLDSTLVATRGRPSREVAGRRAVRLVGAAGAAATAMTLATRGNPGYAAAAAWGLGGVALRNHREGRPAVVRTAAAGLCAVAIATLVCRHRPRA